LISTALQFTAGHNEPTPLWRIFYVLFFMWLHTSILGNVRARWNIPTVIGLGLAVAVSTALQALQSGPAQANWRPYLLLGSATAGLVAAWQLVAGAMITRSPANGPADLTDADPRRIGRYRIQGLLGSGAMGRAYLARDSRGGLVAIKTVRSEYADNPEFRNRFAREVAAIGRVHSRYTTGLLDADVQAVVPWLATPYVAGPNLQHAVDTYGPWAASSVWELAGAVAEALEAIHAAGIVHRDLKPANILLAADGPRVIDFGIARAADASQLTATMNRPGTPGFMAPEQALGGDIGPAADVFALGAVLAYVATGRPPFGTGATDVVLYRIIHQSADLTGIDPALLSLIESCLDKRAEARPNAAAVAAQARAILTPRPAPNLSWLPPAVSTEVGRVPTAATRVLGPRGSSWPIAIVSSAALVVAIASAGLQFVPHNRESPADTRYVAGPTVGPPTDADRGSPAPATVPTTAPPIVPTAAPVPFTGPTIVGPTNQQQAAPPAPPPPLTSVNRGIPGCGETDPRVIWTPAKAGVACSSTTLTLTKQVGWDDTQFLSWAEMRMSLRGQQFPTSYTVAFLVGGLTAPEQLPVNRGGCGGMEWHTSADARTFDSFDVCSDGFVETDRVVGGSVVDKQQIDTLTPGPVVGISPIFSVVAKVSPSSTEFTVSNRVGGSLTFQAPPVGSGTAFISLISMWRNIGATSSFSDFTYSSSV
jgi:serine/threonine protein kinase